MGLRLAFDPEHGEFDLVLGPRGLETSDSLETPVWISLYSDARARASDEILDGSNDPRGWWGDTYSDVEGDVIGSRLWLLDRATSVASTYRFARDYANESLRWMAQDGIADRVEANAERTAAGFLAIHPKIHRATGAIERFEDQWSATREGI